MPFTVNRDRYLTAETKGVPPLDAPYPLSDIPALKWNVLREDLPLPLAVLRMSALEQNSRWMSDYLKASGVLFAPHGKTTMSPELFSLQLAMGAWGITLATAHQITAARKFGIKRILLANQLVGKQAIASVIKELKHDPDFDFYCLVDDVSHAQSLAQAVQGAGLTRPLQVLLEVGYEGGRTGVRTDEAARELARFIAMTPHLSLRGIEGFEGLIGGSEQLGREKRVSHFLARMVDLVAWCSAESLFGPGDILLSAGGSSFYDMVIDAFRDIKLTAPYRVITRSGCYITHDAILYKQAFERIQERSDAARSIPKGLVPALEVWGYVQSRPETTRLIVNIGKRDVGHDDFPLAQRWYRPEPQDTPDRTLLELDPDHIVVQLDDQHCHLSVPAQSPLKVGDMVQFGISHPCLTFDKWRNLFVVDDDYNVKDAIETFF